MSNFQGLAEKLNSYQCFINVFEKMGGEKRRRRRRSKDRSKA